jgi:hypothetical protein
MTQVARLWLDDMGDPITNVKFANRAAKNGVVRSNLQIDDEEHCIKPFTSSPDNLIYIRITTRSSKENRDQEYAFVVHSSALLYHAKEQDFDSILWRVWGPTATLWVACRYTPADFCGQRLLAWNGEIWDFNQYRVKQLGKGFAVETELTRICVMAEELKMGLDVICSLPYVKIVLKQRPPLCYKCLDDDCILTVSIFLFSIFVPLF